MAVLPKHVIVEKGDMKKDAIGTGPFKLKKYTRGSVSNWSAILIIM